MNTASGLAGTVLGGRYRVESALGRGGMGAVYLVRHVRTGERLALKLIHAAIAGDPGLVERFRREARAPAQIDSDHVVRVVDADVAPEIGGAPFLVMEFLRGRDLEHELRARTRLEPREVISYLGQAARALDKAHRLGIVHRDLKPENLFLAERDDGTVCLKILDFGIAKLTGEAAHETRTGSMLGTPLYMAPEQAQATHGPVGPGTDVWALGLIAFRLLTGEIYWRFESGPDLILKILSAPMTAPSALVPWLGPAFDAWFSRCCARRIEQRFSSAGEAVSALAGVFQQVVPPSVSPFGMTGPPPGSGGVGVTRAAIARTGPFPNRGTAIGVIVAGTAGLVTIVAGAILTCTLVGSQAPEPQETPAGQAPPRSPAPPAAPSIAPVSPSPAPADGCKSACARLADCAHVADPSCETNCKNAPEFAGCVKRHESCAEISACGLAAYCGGRGPTGSRSCKATSDCEGACVAAGGDITACVCTCVRAMSPSRANELMMNNLCTTVHCAEACKAPVNGKACLACFAATCSAAALPCKAH
jgi:serine/threonine-protein kinase